MIINRFAAVISGVVIAMATTPDARAYEVSTHRIITAHAVERSQVYANSSILADIGMASNQGGLSSEITFGVEAEDLVAPQATIARVFNHFYDPQFNNYVGRGLTVGATIGHASPDWALEDRGDVTTFGVVGHQFAGMSQEYSFREAQRDMWYVLTGQNPTTRSERSIHMLNALGSVVHHLQDMGQPQHTRNEQHAFGPNAYYEGYTEDNINSSVAGLLRLPANLYPIPQLSSARSYWFSPQTTVDQVPRYVGMAEFTAHNFVSNATGFYSDLNGNLLAHPGLPRPNGFNQDDGSRKDIVSTNLPIVHRDGTLTNENGYFVSSHIVDQLPGTTPKTRLIAMSSIFDRPMVTTLGRRVFTVSDGVFNSGYDVLLPRASAFSTGLIDYFFRGRVNIRRDAGNTGWVFENKSGAGQTMNGQVSLWYEEASGLRYPFPGTYTFNIVNLAPNAANTLAAGEPPSSATKVIAAFQGQIGAEPANISGGYFAVAGKVIDFQRPPVACTTRGPGLPGFSRSNSSVYDSHTGLNNNGSDPRHNPGVVEFGSTPGLISGEFWAIWPHGYVGWRLELRRGSATGPIIYSTGGPVSGTFRFSFNHPGGWDPAQTGIYPKIVPQGARPTQPLLPPPLWGVVLSCPGYPLDNQLREVDFVDMRFTVSTSTGFCNQGYVDFTLDNGSKTKVFLPLGHNPPIVASSNIVEVIAGQHHVSAKTTLTTNQQGCGGVVQFGYSDSSGQHTFPGSGQLITVQ